jgi:hypothetical protein
MVSQSMTAILTVSPGAGNEQDGLRAAPGPGNQFAKRAASAALPERHLVTFSDQRGAPAANAEPP